MGIPGPQPPVRVRTAPLAPRPALGAGARSLCPWAGRAPRPRTAGRLKGSRWPAGAARVMRGGRAGRGKGWGRSRSEGRGARSARASGSSRLELAVMPSRSPRGWRSAGGGPGPPEERPLRPRSSVLSCVPGRAAESTCVWVRLAPAEVGGARCAGPAARGALRFPALALLSPLATLTHAWHSQTPRRPPAPLRAPPSRVRYKVPQSRTRKEAFI